MHTAWSTPISANGQPVVSDPEKRRLVPTIRQHRRDGIAASKSSHERGQRRPADWPSAIRCRSEQFRMLDGRRWASRASQGRAAYAGCTWGRCSDFPSNGGATIKYGKVQIAVFNFASRGAVVRLPEHVPAQEGVCLVPRHSWRHQGTPKVACPLHKKTFSLDSGACLSGDDYAVQVFPVKVEGDDVYLELPPAEVLDKLLATEIGCHLATFRRHQCRADGSIMTRTTAFTLPGLTAGLVVVLGLGCGILLGSRNLRTYDPTLLLYTFGALFWPSLLPTATLYGCNVRRRVCTGAVAGRYSCSGRRSGVIC